MRRRRKNFDLIIVIILIIATVLYFIHSHFSSEDRGIKYYQSALVSYKNADYEKAYLEFGKVPSGSSLKDSARFRQARCATNLGKKELAIKKYKRILRSNSKTSIKPISEYNMANLMLDIKDKRAEKHFHQKRCILLDCRDCNDGACLLICNAVIPHFCA